MTIASGAVHCPQCGERVPFAVDMRSVQTEGGGLWVQLYDAKPRHKCKRGG